MGIGGHLAGRVARGRILRGEVRLYQFAAPDKKRPALVLTRDSAISYLSTVTVAPVTSTIRGVPSEVVLNEGDGMKAPCAVNLHNAVTVSQQRLGKRVAQLSATRMNEVCAALRFSLGCDVN
jgi:mRNA interferase MazF